MADEAGLLRQIGRPLPERQDGRWEAGPVYLPVMTGDEHIAGLLANPIDSQPYRNKLMINAYKSETRQTGSCLLRASTVGECDAALPIWQKLLRVNRPLNFLSAELSPIASI